ncbi:MAG TPA: cation diffusion facilitator family transporter [Bryobacteraceae bacterium]|nr:cation diffusion facilitator family transporter [Bryobacteraceae bacterium]
MRTGQAIALIGMAVTAVLAVLKILIGLAGRSTAVVADGLESAGDFLGSGIVFLGLTVAAKPPDEDHPYGHGRVEILSGLLIGLALAAGGALISAFSLDHLGRPEPPLAGYVVWPLLLSLAAKSSLAGVKFRYGRKINSAALTADAWHDATDSISAIAALCAVGLTLLDPARFGNADRYGGFVVGLIVISAGVRVTWDTSRQLMDTMPDESMMAQIRAAAATVDRVRGVEKCFARKTGLGYHVDLHLEVDPEMTVRQSHEVAHQVRLRVMNTLDWVADVLVHVEPAP